MDAANEKSDRLLFPRNLDLLKSVQFAFSSSWASLTSFLPIFLLLEGRIPERPGTALNGSRLIDSAFSCLGIQKNAITIRIFQEALIIPEVSNKLVLERIHRHIHLVRHG